MNETVVRTTELAEAHSLCQKQLDQSWLPVQPQPSLLIAYLLNTKAIYMQSSVICSSVFVSTFLCMPLTSLLSVPTENKQTLQQPGSANPGTTLQCGCSHKEHTNANTQNPTMLWWNNCWDAVPLLCYWRVIFNTLHLIFKRYSKTRDLLIGMKIKHCYVQECSHFWLHKWAEIWRVWKKKKKHWSTAMPYFQEDIQNGQ